MKNFATSEPGIVVSALASIRETVNGHVCCTETEEKKIPCLRLGRKYVRFDPVAVAAALEGGGK